MPPSSPGIAIPLVSIVLNLLSVAAGYGLITLIFQDGRPRWLSWLPGRETRPGHWVRRAGPGLVSPGQE